jgi:hypothetical protein
MKTLHLNPFKVVLVSVLFFAFQSCVTTVPGSWKNSDISSGRRDDFHQMNTEALRILKANDPKGMKLLWSKDMNAGNHDRQVELLSNHLNDDTYQMLDEYYVVHKYKDTDTVRIKSGDIKRYAIMYPYATTEMYFAFFIPKKALNKQMISLVYGKFDYGWKIIDMELAPYTINGKTAPELYALAREQYDKKEIQAALINTELAIACFKPNEYWRYPDEGDAGKFYTRVHAEVNFKYHYPLVLTQVTSGPMILRVYTKNADNDDGTYPLIYYMTHYDIADTNAVKKENVQIKAAVKKLMPGLADNNKYIYYSAFNKQPNGYTSVDHFDMVDKVR